MKSAIMAVVCITAWTGLLAQPAAAQSSADRSSVGSTSLHLDSPVNRAGSFGAGLLVGEPTGLSLKYWLSDKLAIDGGAGWSFDDPDGFQLHSDLLFHITDLIQVDRGVLPLYLGVGGRVKFVDDGDNRAGLRFPIGLAYLFADAPVEVFVELAPIIDFAPDVKLKWNGGVGLRYYFR